jgi:hypothetical protein
MSLRTILRFSDAAEGEALHEAREQEVRRARLELARRQSAWTEIPETRLVRRGRYLVDAETDFVYVLRRGLVFEPGRAAVGYVADQTPMTYFVDQAGEIVFLEQPGAPRTWSEIVERKARRERAAK